MATVSGLNSTHDTVMVFFQDVNVDQQLKKKPKISETSVNKSARAFSSLFKCEETKKCYKNVSTLHLPPRYIINENNEHVTIEEYMKKLSEMT